MFGHVRTAVEHGVEHGVEHRLNVRASHSCQLGLHRQEHYHLQNDILVAQTFQWRSDARPVHRTGQEELAGGEDRCNATKEPIRAHLPVPSGDQARAALLRKVYRSAP